MSDNYIVSARKYRPQTFDTVVGQQHITTTLKNAIRQQHLAHAYLFCGPRGVGKTTCARILAKTINCEAPTEGMEACNNCPSCQSFQNSASFNIFELDAASNNSVEDIRELVNQVRFAPQRGKYKIYIIDEVHMLSSSAFNAFLKTLEEPPSYAIFILATTEKHKVLPTILSRCQIFDFKRITITDIVQHLQGIAEKEQVVAEEAALHIIAQKSEGCMRDALSMMDRIAGFSDQQLTYTAAIEHLNLLDTDFYFALGDCLLSQDVAGAFLELDKMLLKGFEGNTILQGLAEHFRNLLLCKEQRMVKLLDVPREHKPLFFEKAQQMPPSFILSALNILSEAELNYKAAVNKRLHTEMCLIRLCYLLQATSGEETKKKVVPVKPAEKTKPQAPSLEALKPASPTPLPATSVVEENDNAFTTGSSPEPKKVQQETNQPVHNARRRITRDIMNDMEQQLQNVRVAETPKANLTQEKAAGIFADYTARLKELNKSFLYTQFSLMRVELVSEDEVRVIAPTAFAEESAKEQRNLLIEFFCEKSGMRVRITTEIQQERNDSEVQKIPTKTEVFDLLAEKNPSLRLLKERLGLQIDY